MAVIPQNTWFVAIGAAAASLPDPEVLARRALSEMSLATAEVHTAPGYPDNEVVGVDAWLWVPSAQWRTLSNSLTVGATTVAVAAVPDHVSWDMGDGATKTCYGAGRPWVVGMTDAATTDCGYTYRSISASQPDGLFHIVARITYQVDWTCHGACTTPHGSLGLVPALAGGGQIRSVQRQTVVVN
jgi:hypothetical protein